MAISRRRFAALMGMGALGLPILRHGRRASAQSMGPMRFLAVRTPHGVDRDWWIPRTSGGAEPPSTDMALEELTFDYDQAILQPLMAWRDRITVLDGIDSQVTKEGTRGGVRTAHGHNEQGTMLTGAQPPENREGNFDGHPSLDYWLHSQLGAYALLNAGIEGAGTWKAMSFDEAGVPRASETSPDRVFRAAFPMDFVPPDPEEPTIDYTAGANRLASYNDGVLRRLRDRLTIDRERQKLDAHIAAMASAQLVPGTGPGGFVGACTTSGSDQPGRNGNIGNYGEVEVVARLHAQVIGQAFACGRARCATLHLLNDYPNWFSDLPQVRTPQILAHYGTSFRFHENLVHDYWGASGSLLDTLRVGYLAGLRWSATHFVAVLEVLDSMIDPLDPSGGSILDNTIVYWHNEFGHDGHDNQHTRHPIVIAGGDNRTLRLGRYLRLRNIASNERVPHNKVLTSICHAMGVEVDYFGDRDLRGRSEYMGPLTQLMV